MALAREAGAYQLQHFGTRHRVRMKDPVDPVTEVDTFCETLIIQGIRRHFPDHAIVAEEGGGGAAGESRWRWIVDPLDGTVNYLHGYPLFCVCIALQEEGRTRLGVVYEPNRDELFLATDDVPSTCNGERIAVSSTERLLDALVATGFAYGRERGELEINIPVFNALLRQTRAIRRPGVAGVDLAYVAAGRLDGFWEYYLKPWDVAAGALIVTQAGGRVSMMDGTSFDPFGTEILATNTRLHDTMSTAIAQAAI